MLIEGFTVKRERIIEIATYIVVFMAMWVISPWIGKLLDGLYYSYRGIFSHSLPVFLIGGIIAVVGLSLVIWTIVVFKVIGKGTPNPKLPPSELVVAGPYLYSRNPMALGGFLFLLGESGIYQSPSLSGIAVLFAIILYFNAVYIEEPELRKRFGQSYEAYCKSVPRFLPNPFWRRNV
jgi:protein-S-isoprenylcysteine O-methyltransferase Ste14